MLLALGLCLLTALIIWDFWRKQKLKQMLDKANIPGSMPLPLVGNLLQLLGNDTTNVFNLLKQWRLQYGRIYRLFGPDNQIVLIVEDAKFMEGVLSNRQLIAKNSMYSMLTTWLGQGLLLSSGAKWQARRKIITPTFHFKILEQFVEVFDQQSDVLIEHLREKADGKTPVNIFPYVCLMALDVIAETAMGVKINAQDHPDFEYAKAVTDVTDIVATRFVKPFQRFDFIFRISSNASYRHQQKCIKIMHDFTDNVIKGRRSTLQKSIDEGWYQKESNDTNELGIKKRMAFLDVLLQSSISDIPLSNQDIREEVETFMFAGHDTTTSAISFTCYLLSRHPKVQQKVFEEIRQVIGDDRDKSVSMQDLQNLKYLDCVIKESLRMFPPVPIIGRKTEQNVQINGQTIPANADILLIIFAACQDPNYFPQPHEFRPERFDNAEESAKINPFAYVPFSAGPRNCIGQKFALLEMKSTISKILRHFELLPLGEDVKLLLNIVLRSSTGCNVGLRNREY